MQDTVDEEKETTLTPDQEKEKEWKKLQAEKQQEIDKRAKEMLRLEGLTGDKAEAALPMFQLQAKLEGYVQEKKKETQQGGSDPGGKVLQLEVEKIDEDTSRIVFAKEQERDWVYWGWGNASLERVRKGVQEQLAQTELDISPEQEKLILSLLIASGRTPQELLKLFPTALEAGKQYAQGNSQGREEHAASTVYGFLGTLGIREDYIRRFILAKEYRRQNDNEYAGGPGNIEELAYQMSYKDQDEWGINGTFPTLELRIITDKDTKKIDTKKSRYYVNEGNVQRWGIRGQHHQYDINPTGTPNYYQEVKIEKENTYSHITLGAMFDSEKTMFKSEDGVLQYDELEMQMQIAPWVMGSMREMFRTYENDMSKEGKISEVINGLFYMSPLTRRTFGKNMLYYMSTLPLNFEGSKKGEFPASDHIVGSAMTDMMLAYTHFTDFPELEKVLGQDSSFFTKEGMEKAMETTFESATGMSGSESAKGFVRDSTVKLMNEAFIKVGDKYVVVDHSKTESQKTGKEREAEKARKAAFIKFINFFPLSHEDANKSEIVRQALKDAMQERYGFMVNGKFDKYSLWQAELIAHSVTNWSGISAYNDIDANAPNSMTKFLRTAQYRLKMATSERGGPAGNPTSVFLFKQMLVPFFSGFTTTTKSKERGGNKTPGEVLHEIQKKQVINQEVVKKLELELAALEGKNGEGKTTHEWHAKKYEIDTVKKKLAMEYRDQAGQLAFDNDAMRDYAANHFDRAWKLYEQVSGAKEIDFAKFTTTDAYGHQTFQKDAFQKEVQKEYLTHIRYMISTYGELDYTMPFRAPKLVPDPKKPMQWKTEWETMPLGQALFGHELLNRKEFWQEKEQGGWAYDENGRHVIDYKKVQKDKITLWKNWAGMKLSADLKRHLKRSMRDRSVYDKNYHYTYYLNVVNALESIPGAIMGDEYNMSGVSIPKSFFSKEDMRIIKQKAGIGTTWFWTRATYDALRGKDEKDHGWGFSAAFALIASEVIAVKG